MSVALTMGSTRLWLPSLRSVDSQRGGFSIVLLGHVLSGRCNGLNGWYFFHGSASIGILGLCVSVCEATRRNKIEDVNRKC